MPLFKLQQPKRFSIPARYQPRKQDESRISFESPGMYDARSKNRKYTVYLLALVAVLWLFFLLGGGRDKTPEINLDSRDAVSPPISNTETGN